MLCRTVGWCQTPSSSVGNEGVDSKLAEREEREERGEREEKEERETVSSPKNSVLFQVKHIE